ncbi:MAG TPA: class I SAM-dependent methyltransferase [Solirubrobacterales bacterium]|jgi:SAM-dependent methyltransferase|nr:class I SAM-dependent methyltransferase [Solirubrobacterales bacterium]
MSETPGAIWHDVECGSYGADLRLWEELAVAAGGSVLELGCGTGRVVLHLARRQHPTVGLDSDPELIESLRARATGLPVTTVLADARDFTLDQEVALALAPTQMLQLLADAEARIACLRCVAAALRPGGRFAAAILEGMPEPDGAPPPLPDVREVDGWVYSSLAVEAAVGPGEIVVHRLRQTVSPDGELAEQPNQVRITTFPAAQLEQEAAEAGLRPVERHEIPATDIHVGSVVVVLEKAA